MENGSILGTLLIMAACLGFVLFLIKVTVPRIFNRVLSHYGHRLELAEQIMNTRRAPMEWLTKQMAKMERTSDPDALARIQRRAQTISVNRLQAIIKFLKNSNTFDSQETRHMVLTELTAVLGEWQEEGWARLEPDPDYVPLRERTEPDGRTRDLSSSDSA